jgi:hypothetical protein
MAGSEDCTEPPVTLELRLILIGVAILAISGGIFYWDYHERHKGAAVCEVNDLKAAKAQLAKQALELADYQEQLSDAVEKLEDAKKLLAVAANTPIPHLVCHQANPGNVPKVPTPASSGNSPPGPTQPVHGSDFDPSRDIRRLSIGYERKYVTPADDALNRWPTKGN